MLGIVILNYNTWSLAVKCIESIKKTASNLPMKIYVVDNCSKERPLENDIAYIKNNSIFIKTDRNMGYSAGNNYGLSKAISDNCEYIMIVNTDVEFVDDSIQEMYSFLKKNKEIGIVAPQIYDINNTFSPIYMITKLTAIGKLKNMLLKTPFRFLFANFEKEFIRKEEIYTPLKVFSVSGCCFMMSRKCATSIYPLDENTFLYEEEYILGVILERLNITAFVIPNTHVIHAHGKSTEKKPLSAYEAFIDSEQYYMREYLNTNVVLRYFIYIIRNIVKIGRAIKYNHR